ncbi:MAG: hypothetical protein IT384_04790 [Deltaproteobacteria bacterium]|nr:hypothetical protein [Deltaproteobacteria bacterium]
MTWGKIQKHDDSLVPPVTPEALLDQTRQDFSDWAKETDANHNGKLSRKEVRAPLDNDPNFFDALLAAKHQATAKLTGRAEIPRGKLVAALVADASKLIGKINKGDKKVITAAEDRRLDKAGKLGGLLSGRFQDVEMANDRKGYVLVDDPAVAELKSRDDFLRYNFQDAVNDPTLGRAVTLSQVPLSLRKPLRAARDTIEAHYAGMSDGDFSGGFNSLFAVYKKPGDKTIVGYVAHGSGSGEPDYSEEYFIAVSLKGKRIAEENPDY